VDISIPRAKVIFVVLLGPKITYTTPLEPANPNDVVVIIIKDGIPSI
jgi:hypothetical protein